MQSKPDKNCFKTVTTKNLKSTESDDIKTEKINYYKKELNIILKISKKLIYCEFVPGLDI